MSARERWIPEPTIDDYKAENARLKREVALLRESIVPSAFGQRFGVIRPISPYVLQHATVDMVALGHETLLFGALKEIARRLKKDKTVLIIMHYGEEQQPPDPYTIDPRHDDLVLRIDGRIYET